jgi:hypothetical protein
MEEKKNEYKILVRKLIGKQPFGRQHRWID